MLIKLRVLIIDDDEDDYFITSHYLDDISDFVVEHDWCYRAEDALELLQKNEYDAYFIDYRLGAQTGLEIMREAMNCGCDKPVILLTGKGSSHIDKMAVEHGAYDYLVKDDLTSEKLERSLRYAIERYRSFKIISDNEKKYKLLFENSMSFIFSCDNLLHFVECNAAAFSLFKCSPHDLKGESLFKHIQDRKDPFLKKMISNKMNINNYMVDITNKNDEKIVGNLSLHYFDLGGENNYWQGIILNETDRYSREIINLQKEKHEATYRLMRTLAHEIRNPLTNISLSLEELNENLQEQQRPYMDIITRNAERINTIISEILKSSKAINLKLEPTDLRTIIEEVIEESMDRIVLLDVKLNLILSQEHISILADAQNLKIALLNIVINSIESMNKFQKELTIEIRNDDTKIEILIQDNGCGINEENLKSLFEPYFTTKKTGMGLGLISALNIIQSHKATIRVDSKEQIGTAFVIIFDK